MFAYNEEKNIEKSVNSIFNNVSENLQTLTVIANGCTDNTVGCLQQLKEEKDYEKLNIVNLAIGDKCNAWNEYMHNLHTNSEVHFFVDADVQFSEECFDKLFKTLIQSPEETVAIAGMPISGRNKDFYRSLITERSCFFGNLYGLKRCFVEKVKQENFHLPIGLNWIDSFLTKAVNTDIQFFNYNLPNRVTYLEGAGYFFDSLSPFKRSDIKLYFNRIARYELGKLQEKHLDKLKIQDWPKDMKKINLLINQNFVQEAVALSAFKRYLARKRLSKLLQSMKET